MKRYNRHELALVIGAAVWLVAVSAASAEGQAPPPNVQKPQAGARAPSAPRSDAGQFTVAEVQQMFDAMTLMQAEHALRLTDAQFPHFVSRLGALQQQRRRHQQERRQLIQQLAKLTAPAVNPIDEGQVKVQLKALVDLDARAQTDTRSACEAIDEMLTVRQQAQFRILEEQIERRTFDLLARARRGAAEGAAPIPGPIK